MLRKLNNKSGFTLVEIMIVVAIIALLAAIAVPNFLRARKRSQATAILEEMRLIDGAKDQYAIENNLAGSSPITWPQVKLYLKVGTRLYNQAVQNDALGNPILLGTIDTPPTIDALTRTNFTDVIDNPAAFWGSFSN
jgi:prepilin-type N-terminal cleavage/methylation domain-containing protein